MYSVERTRNNEKINEKKIILVIRVENKLKYELKLIIITPFSYYTLRQNDKPFPFPFSDENRL